MANDPIMNRVTVPSFDFRGNKFVNQDGTLTDVAQGFFDSLQNFLVKNIGEEGLVAPGQTTMNRLNIQNNIVVSQTGNVVYTCLPGTILYDYTTVQAYVALEASVGTGIPIFKQIVTM